MENEFDPIDSTFEEKVEKLKELAQIEVLSEEQRTETGLMIASMDVDSMDHRDLVEFFITHRAKVIADTVEIKDEITEAIGLYGEDED